MDTSTFRTTAIAAAAASAAWCGYKLIQIGKRESFLPPGPDTVPLLGNLHLIPKTNIHYKVGEAVWAPKQPLSSHHPPQFERSWIKILQQHRADLLIT
ncbi:hypothetical protein FRC02_002216 [Tulasnella sp. 418]|nr:hypothetical protein FRC02_002216 [Tulasnella sp. 418]